MNRRCPVQRCRSLAGTELQPTVAVDVARTVCVAVCIIVFVVAIVTASGTVEVLGKVAARTQADVT
jgi:hypothetical protein